MQTLTESQKSAHDWCARYEWLKQYFPEEEAFEYAHEMSEVAEGRKDETQRAAHEIRRQMKLLTQIESLVHAICGLVVVALFVLPALWQPSVLPDSGIARVTWMLACWFSAGIVGCKRFWKEYLDILRRERLQCFWEWRSATLRFPVRCIIDSGFSDRSELPPEASEIEDKSPHSPN